LFFYLIKSNFNHHHLGSSSSKDESTDDNLIWKHEISPLIETLITAYQSIKRLFFVSKPKTFSLFLFFKENHYEQFDRTSNDLYNALLKHNLFGKKSNKKRGELLKTLFGFIESDNSIVKYHVARLSLAVKFS